MLIIFAIYFNKKLASYSQLMSITKIVNETQGLIKNKDSLRTTFSNESLEKSILFYFRLIGSGFLAEQ